MLHRCQDFYEDLRPDLYSKYQHQDRKSSASSNSSSGSSGGLYPKITQTSRHVLANAFQQNWDDTCSNQTDYDDSLTNLNWLHNVNPNKINEQMSLVSASGSPRFIVNTQMRLHPNSQVHHSQHHTSVSPFITIRPPAPPETLQTSQPDYKHNCNLKPPFSYAILISWAMRELGQSKITLSDIYNWIIGNFAYYRHADSSWQNSIRHNLSLGKCFEKVPRRKDEPGKGGFWRINPQHAKTLELNLSKIKYDPSSHQICEVASQYPYSGPKPSSQSSHQRDQVYHSNSTSTPVKRSRKSPLTVTQEDWDSPDSYNSERSDIEIERKARTSSFMAFNDRSLEDEESNFNETCFELSPFDTSSSDSNNYGPDGDNSISMNNFNESSLDDILDIPMLLDKEEHNEHDYLRLSASNGDFCDFFNTPKDDLHELNCLLGIF